MKAVHFLYQLQVVSDDVYIRVALEKPRKWLTKSTLIVTLICFSKNLFFFVCSYLKLLKGFLSMTLKVSSQNQKATNSYFPLNLAKPSSTPKSKTTIAYKSFQMLDFVHNPLTLIKGVGFDQSLREFTEKPRKTLKISLEIRGERKERKNIGKYYVNRPNIERSEKLWKERE
jgi:hypothetical protein